MAALIHWQYLLGLSQRQCYCSFHALYFPEYYTDYFKTCFTHPSPCLCTCNSYNVALMQDFQVKYFMGHTLKYIWFI